MSRHDSISPEDVDNETTGITSLTTRALLEGMCFDIRSMRGEIAEYRGAVLAFEARLREVERVAPLVSTHERLLQQVRGAAAATKILYALVGVLTSGSAIAIAKYLLR